MSDDPMLTTLDEVEAKVTVLRHKKLMEKRVEVGARGGDLPLLSLTPGDARALGYILRRLAADAEDPR